MRPEEKLFAQLYVEKYPDLPEYAVIEAGYNRDGAKAVADQLLNTDEIASYIAELKSLERGRSELTDQELREYLGLIISENTKFTLDRAGLPTMKNSQAAIKAIHELGELNREYVKKVDIKSSDGSMSPMPDLTPEQAAIWRKKLDESI